MNKKISIQGTKIPYCKKSIMEEANKGQNYSVIGEIGSKGIIKDQEPTGNYLYEDKEIPVYPLNTYGKLYGKVGYVQQDEEENTYLLVRKSRLPKIILGLLLLAALIAALIFGIRWYMNRPVLEKSAVPITYETGAKKVDKDSILMPGYGDFVVTENTTKIDQPLVNPNINHVYFKFKITLDKTGETLYETDLLEPGTGVLEFDLSKKFKKGTYPITVAVQTFNTEDHTQPLNGGEVKTRIVAVDKSENTTTTTTATKKK